MTLLVGSPPRNFLRGSPRCSSGTCGVSGGSGRTRQRKHLKRRGRLFPRLTTVQRLELGPQRAAPLRSPSSGKGRGGRGLGRGETTENPQALPSLPPAGLQPLLPLSGGWGRDEDGFSGWSAPSQCGRDEGNELPLHTSDTEVTCPPGMFLHVPRGRAVK